MGILSCARIIREGDHVILWKGFDDCQSAIVSSSNKINNKFGTFELKELIGKPFGSKLCSSGRGGGWVYALRPTPELWTRTLQHRTQILYAADISLVLHHLNIRPGSVVVESGTGSGSLSTSFARCIAPHGHLHTFEFNAHRVQEARKDFKNNGIDKIATCRHLDVCASGFPMIEGGVDAVFLDLPKPWVVLKSCKDILVSRGKICSFSPCIEQVQRSCLELSNLGFSDIRTYECLIRAHEIRRERYEIPDMGFERELYTSLAFEKELQPVVEEKETESDGGAKRVRETSEEEKKGAAADEEAQGSTKKIKLDEDSEEQTKSSSSSKSSQNNKQSNKRQLPNPHTKFYRMMRTLPEMYGHTGYLTFAVAPVQNNPSTSST